MDYIIFDYSDGTKDGKNEPEVRAVNEKEVWEIIQAGHEKEDKKIAVYKLGECVIDFS